LHVGISTAVTILLWTLLTSSTPAEHRFISKVERQYIINSLEGQVSDVKPTVRCCCVSAVRKQELAAIRAQLAQTNLTVLPVKSYLFV